ncbi:MAG TPA: alpha/beta hydrolase, partial [Phenylobacterium sp.]|nr:alpha/beta hydrolase [Phenylobacterium sp.]
RRFADTPFGRIAYVARGHGPLALFLHAWPLNSYQWRGALTRLSDTRRCVAPDFMALGYTEVAPAQEITPATQADMLAAFMDALGERRADLVANDSGGLVAQMFAARHPERVRSLLLTNCDVQHDNPAPSFAPLVQAAEAGVLAERLLARLADNLALARSPQGLGVGYANPETLTAESVQCYLGPLVGEPARRDQLQRYTIALGHNDLVAAEPALRRLPAPVRIVWGVDDTVFAPTSPEVLDGIFPHSLGVRRVAGAKLFFPEERPDVIAEEARALWNRAGTA